MRRFVLFQLFIFISFSLLFSGCQKISQQGESWEQVDIAIRTLPVLKTENKEVTLSEDFQKNHAVVIDKSNNLFFVKKTEMDITLTKKSFKVIEKGKEFSRNELLNPETFIGGSLSSSLPMEIFKVNTESITVDYKEPFYSIYQGNKSIITGTMIAFLNPWIFTTQHSIINKDQMWDYIALNTETKLSVTISLPGLIQSIETMDSHLLLKVVNQVFFGTSQWVFLTKEKKVIKLGSMYADVHMIGEYPESNWCIVSDWYNQELSVRNRDTLEKLYTLPLDKYLISGITSFQDKDKNWHVWIIPVLTVEKFTSNVFWISLKKNKMTIQNLDYHDPFLVSNHTIDSEGNLYMIEKKPIDTEWSDLEQRWAVKNKSKINKDTIIIKINPWKKTVQKLPIEWVTDINNKENSALFMNPGIEIKSDEIIVRNISGPNYLESVWQAFYNDYKIGIFYEKAIDKKIKKQTIQVIDTITLQPLDKEIPVSDIKDGLLWSDYLLRGIQNILLIPFQSFDAT